jgi:hypothetical protein
MSEMGPRLAPESDMLGNCPYDSLGLCPRAASVRARDGDGADFTNEDALRSLALYKPQPHRHNQKRQQI